MRPAALTTAIVAVLCVASGASASQDVSFGAPGQAGGRTLVENATWAFVSLAGDPQASLEFDLADARLSTFERTYMEGRGAALSDTSQVAEIPMGEKALGDQQLRAQFPFGPASIYLEGARLEVDVDLAHASVEVWPDGECIRTMLTFPEWARLDGRTEAFCPPGGGARLVIRDSAEGPMPFSMHAEGLSVTEWHHATVSCRAGSCPTGGEHRSDSVPAPSQEMNLVRTGHDHIDSRAGSVSGGAVARTIVVGGPLVDVVVAGWVRLPQVAGLPCEPCRDGQTLQAEGQIRLERLHPQPDNRLGTHLAGTPTSVRLDENGVDPSSFGFAAGAATVVGAAAVAITLKLLWPALFSRRIGKGVLDGRNRRIIYDFVVAHPGASYREIARRTSIANGTTRHHLTMLVRSKMLVERMHGRLRCFFPQQAAEGDWHRHVVLRDSALRSLHDWLQTHPRAAQGDVLAAMETLYGWKRSTAQHRLGKLCREGLVSVEEEGRFKRYSVEPPRLPSLNHSPGTAASSS